ncbi:hypothetical protein IFM61392_06529 [Aspergillus lentulus]|nr:hypothetical protein IFM47457_06587 [Aspergillus lentulus]GFG10692.1 hypothetical protein IFM61392_06529 [Aspergillus lentulus]
MMDQATSAIPLGPGDLVQVSSYALNLLGSTGKGQELCYVFKLAEIWNLSRRAKRDYGTNMLPGFDARSVYAINSGIGMKPGIRFLEP